VSTHDISILCTIVNCVAMVTLDTSFLDKDIQTGKESSSYKGKDGRSCSC